VQLGKPETAHGPTLEYRQLPHGSSTHSPCGAHRAGTVKANAPLSRITLALLEDSGWYVVHNDSALVVAQSHFTWGFGEGLAFLAQPCSARSSQYFCEVQVPALEGCVPDRCVVE
jgi:hypothetical protein